VLTQSQYLRKYGTSEERRAYALKRLDEIDRDFQKLRREPSNREAEAERDRLHRQWREDNENVG